MRRKGRGERREGGEGGEKGWREDKEEGRGEERRRLVLAHVHVQEGGETQRMNKEEREEGKVNR